VLISFTTDRETIATIVEVEPVGQIYAGSNKWKTDKLFLHNIMPLTEWFDSQTEKTKLFAVKQNGYASK
jgi:hypothetical protein